MRKNEFVYGIHTVTAILQRSPQRVLRLFVLEDRNDPQIQTIVHAAKKNHIALQLVSRQSLEKHVMSPQHQGVVAECVMKKALSEDELENLLTTLKEPPFLLILDDVQDPHNLGACLRSADAAGVHAVISSKDNSVGLTPVVQKVASGAVETVPFVQVTNLARAMRALRDQGIWLLGMAGEAKKNIYQADCKGPIAFVLGAEGKGMRRLTREHCDDLLSIPLRGAVESLNVSVATAVCLYEAVRQRMV